MTMVFLLEVWATFPRLQTFNLCFIYLKYRPSHYHFGLQAITRAGRHRFRIRISLAGSKAWHWHRSLMKSDSELNTFICSSYLNSDWHFTYASLYQIPSDVLKMHMWNSGLMLCRLLLPCRTKSCLTKCREDEWMTQWFQLLGPCTPPTNEKPFYPQPLGAFRISHR